MAHTTSKSGIYQIASPSGRRYVGSAVNLSRRRIAHFNQLGRGIHHCKALQAAAAKYGAAELVFSILELCEPGQLIIREQHYMDAARPRSLYNSTLVAGSILGLKLGPHSDATKRKLATMKLGKPLSEEHKASLSASRNTSGRHGVCVKAGRFRAYVNHDGKRKHLGSYDTLNEATAARAAFLLSPAEFVVPVYSRTAAHAANIGKAQAGRGVSGYAGVSKYSRLGRADWAAYIVVGGRQSHIGLFPTKEDAASARVNILSALESVNG